MNKHSKRLTRDVGDNTTAKARNQIRESSRRLAELYAQLRRFPVECSQIVAAADLSSGPAAYERMRKQLTALEPDIKVLADQIRGELAILRKAQASLPEFSTDNANSVRSLQDPSKGLDAEILALSNRLLEIAGAQEEAVRVWNVDPVDHLRQAFDERMARFHAEFAAVLAQKKALLDARKTP